MSPAGHARGARTARIALGVALCALAVGVLWWRETPGVGAKQSPAPVIASADAGRDAGLQGAPGLTRAEPLQAGRVRLGDSSLDASTQEKVDWLNRHHVPPIGDLNDAVRDHKALALRDLQAPLDGRLLARAEVAAMLRPDLRDAALARLDRAAADGSIGALVSLDRVYQTGALADPVRAEAYARVAAMRGDWGMRLPSYVLDEVQNWHANLLAQRIARDYDRERRRRGLAPLGRDLRPGLDAQLDLMPDALAEWNAVRRALSEGKPPPPQ